MRLASSLRDPIPAGAVPRRCRPSALALALLLALAACRVEGSGTPSGLPAGPEPPVPAAVAAMEDRIESAGVAVEELRRLAGHAICTGEEWRYRFHFGGRNFLNVSRFPSAAAAVACLETYREQVNKGGSAALDRLMPLVAVEGPYLFQFSEAMVDPRRREAILAAARRDLPEDG